MKLKMPFKLSKIEDVVSDSFHKIVKERVNQPKYKNAFKKFLKIINK